MIFTTQEQINAALLEWQTRLRLLDWHICVRIVRASEIDKDTQGHISMTITRREARIDLLDPVDYPNKGETRWLQDHERTLVHELCHIHFEAIMGELDDATQTRLYSQMEQAITSIDWALVSAKRSGKVTNPLPLKKKQK